jgi:hypothetical protein
MPKLRRRTMQRADPTQRALVFTPPTTRPTPSVMDVDFADLGDSAETL